MLIGIRPPLDLAGLAAVLPDTWRAVHRAAAPEHEYPALARLLEQHPNVILRAYGFSEELAELSFLRHFRIFAASP